MRFDIVTIFPDFFTGPLDYGIVRRAREAALVDVRIHDLRAFTHDRHRTVDDRPFGGGEGMVLKPEPLFEAVESLLATANALAQASTASAAPPENIAVILLSASGKLFRQPDAERFAARNRIVLLCGRYEGVDERVAQHLATDEVSIGDFVLSGGELAAALILDAVTRLIPGALGNEASSVHESFAGLKSETASEIASEINTGMNSGVCLPPPVARPAAAAVLLDCPHYTRPAEFRGWAVPEVLLGGNHEEIRRWRHAQALEKTRRNRPDLLRS